MGVGIPGSCSPQLKKVQFDAEVGGSSVCVAAAVWVGRRAFVECC